MVNNSLKVNAMLQEPKRNITLLVIFMISSFSACAVCLFKFNVFQAFSESFYILITTMTVLLGLEFVKRVFYFFDGLLKINSEHEGHFLEIIKAAFSFNNPSTTAIVLNTVCFVALIKELSHGQASLSFIEFKNSELFITDKKYISLTIAIFSALCFSYLLLDLIKLNECKTQKLQALFDLGGLDYGSSMACSYFFGYLKIILPPDGKENEGLVGRIEHFQGNNNVTVPVKKLFILIPASFYIPTDLKESSDGWLEAIENRLEYKLNIDRAGVPKRQYQNTVYKIIPGGLGSGNRVIHVVTEGATPLLTFFEVQQYSHKYSGTYREYKREIGKSFYRTLQQLLNDNPDCRDLCELVYYEDYEANGTKVNPAKILLQRIQEKIDFQI